MTEAKEYPLTLKPNGSVILPGEIIDLLTDGTLYVSVDAEPGLRIWTSQEFEEVIEKVKAMSKAQQIMLRPLFSTLVKCEISSNGSICIPKHLRDYAGFEKGKQAAVLITKDGKRHLRNPK